MSSEAEQMMHSSSETTYYNLHQPGTEAFHNRNEQNALDCNTSSTTLPPQISSTQSQPHPEMVWCLFSLIMILDAPCLGRDSTFHFLRTNNLFGCSCYFKQASYCLLLLRNCPSELRITRLCLLQCNTFQPLLDRIYERTPCHFCWTRILE